MDDKAKIKSANNSAYALAVLVGTPLWLTWSGFTLQHLWAWFVVPFGCSPLGLAQSIGLGLLATFATYRHVTTEKDMGCVLVAEIMVPGTFLLFGWIAHRFM